LKQDPYQSDPAFFVLMVILVSLIWSVSAVHCYYPVISAKNDDSVKSYNLCYSVIPVKTGIQFLRHVMDPRLRGDDRLADFLRDHQK
jgi:hypothetical protein